jgi:hypothetical protein
MGSLLPSAVGALNPQELAAPIARQRDRAANQLGPRVSDLLPWKEIRHAVWRT